MPTYFINFPHFVTDDSINKRFTTFSIFNEGITQSNIVKSKKIKTNLTNYKLRQSQC